MKRILLTAVLLLFAFSLFSQAVTKAEFKEEDNAIFISYSLKGGKKDMFTVEFYYTLDGGETFTGPVKVYKGTAGKGIKPGNHEAVINAKESFKGVDTSNLELRIFSWRDAEPPVDLGPIFEESVYITGNLSPKRDFQFFLMDYTQYERSKSVTLNFTMKNMTNRTLEYYYSDSRAALLNVYSKTTKKKEAWTVGTMRIEGINQLANNHYLTLAPHEEIVGNFIFAWYTWSALRNIYDGTVTLYNLADQPIVMRLPAYNR